MHSGEKFFVVKRLDEKGDRTGIGGWLPRTDAAKRNSSASRRTGQIADPLPG
jgi:hypothetical protein